MHCNGVCTGGWCDLWRHFGWDYHWYYPSIQFRRQTSPHHICHYCVLIPPHHTAFHHIIRLIIYSILTPALEGQTLKRFIREICFLQTWLLDKTALLPTIQEQTARSKKLLWCWDQGLVWGRPSNQIKSGQSTSPKKKSSETQSYQLPFDSYKLNMMCSFWAWIWSRTSNCYSLFSRAEWGCAFFSFPNELKIPTSGLIRAYYVSAYQVQMLPS